ncbi:hypothetical protein C7B76_07195 [filamentous cyanobacterium CCP2]|nr:hypothetical protein C7B76_07195 [filamentous cyanobacterium CCP2]
MKDFQPIEVGNKLTNMGKRLRRLNRYQTLTLNEYLQDEDLQSIIERLLEQVIQSALDINRAFLKRVAGISLESEKVPTNAETFTLVAQYGLISLELGQQMKKSGGFRNVLAHLYDEIIPEKVYEALQNALTDYPEYLAEVENYLNLLEQADAEENSES